jgi:hypothetical protein
LDFVELAWIVQCGGIPVQCLHPTRPPNREIRIDRGPGIVDDPAPGPEGGCEEHGVDCDKGIAICLQPTGRKDPEWARRCLVKARSNAPILQLITQDLCSPVPADATKFVIPAESNTAAP